MKPQPLHHILTLICLLAAIGYIAIHHINHHMQSPQPTTAIAPQSTPNSTIDPDAFWDQISNNSTTTESASGSFSHETVNLGTITIETFGELRSTTTEPAPPHLAEQAQQLVTHFDNWDNLDEVTQAQAAKQLHELFLEITQDTTVGQYITLLDLIPTDPQTEQLRTTLDDPNHHNNLLIWLHMFSGNIPPDLLQQLNNP